MKASCTISASVAWQVGLAEDTRWRVRYSKYLQHLQSLSSVGRNNGESWSYSGSELVSTADAMVIFEFDMDAPPTARVGKWQRVMQVWGYSDRSSARSFPWWGRYLVGSTLSISARKSHVQILWIPSKRKMNCSGVGCLKALQ